MNKRLVIGSSTVGAVLLVVAGAVLWNRSIRGIGPALLPAAGDIAKDIGIASATSTPPDFPLLLPPGFSIGVFATGLNAPRAMAFDLAGRLLVSLPQEGKIVALSDDDRSGTADRITTIADGLIKPHGIAFQNPWRLFVAETDKIVSFDYAPKTGRTFGKDIVAELPGGGNHWTRSLAFLPPDAGTTVPTKLFVSAGSSCNVCREEDDRRAAVSVVDVGGKTMKPYVRGLRNAVFMAVHPGTKKVWATEMGRDLLGDDTPPDEINVLEDGKNYGWPICYGKNVHDTAFDTNTYIRAPCTEPFEAPSFADLPAHSAPLGLAFVPEGAWPREYWNQLLVAYHGSWNRSVPTGYKIVRVHLDSSGRYPGMTQTSSPIIDDFISGWLTPENTALGRPVALLFGPDGALYISDDKAGIIYRVSYGGKKAASGAREGAGIAVRPENLRPGHIVKSPLFVTGKARGWWFFEASFPIRITDADGKELGTGIARARGDWMTEEYVPFEATISFVPTSSAEGFVEFERNNPSHLPENAQKLRIGVRFQ